MSFIIWIIFFLGSIIIEILTPGSFYFFSLGIGFLFAGLSTFIIKNILLQWIIFIIASILSIFLIKFFVKEINPKNSRLANVDDVKGKKGVVLNDILPHVNQGLIKVGNEEWRAVSDHEIKKGEYVQVLDVEGTHLIVKKI